MTSTSNVHTSACVCVFKLLGKVGRGIEREAKPQDGGLCETTHTTFSTKPHTTLTLTAQCIASRSVSKQPTFASRLLVDSRVW